MKKILVFVGLVVTCSAAFGQDIKFTKGDVTPGKIKSMRIYEDFISGVITITGDAGASYSFVKANLVVTTKAGKKLEYTLAKKFFTEEQSSFIIKADDEGTVYTFTNIIVKDSNGKEIGLPEVKYEFPSVAR